VADAVPAPGQNVWGVVYEIDQRDVGELDRSEGFSPNRPGARNAYVRKECHVYVDDDSDRPLAAFAYFAIREVNPPPPNAEYKRLIAEGAKFWHLPADYIEQLEAIPASP
jgi:gamma-glutamylcyclotransferase (GGCT)/AIG2-like uncharacterized protein YtfP